MVTRPQSSQRLLRSDVICAEQAQVKIILTQSAVREMFFARLVLCTVILGITLIQWD